MKRLREIVDGDVRLVVFECGCGFRIGLNATFVEPDPSVCPPCPQCLARQEGVIVSEVGRGGLRGVIVAGGIHAQAMSDFLIIEGSAWFQVTPLPDDDYEIVYKPEHHAGVLKEFAR